jgi:hypothetical protein
MLCISVAGKYPISGLRPAIFGALGRLPPVFVYTIIIATLPVFDNPNSNTSPGESIQVVKN